MFDSIDLMEKFFQWRGNLTLHLLGVQSGCGHEHIRHGHNNLGFFLTRSDR